MANTYTQIHIQAVFAVENRNCIIKDSWEESLYKYITGIVQNHNHKLLAINGMPDHLHIFFGFRPVQALSDLMQIVKKDSSKWINRNKLSRGHFSWQDGFGAFSYSKSHVPSVIRYVMNQKEHHRKKTFTEEYVEMLEKFGVDYDNKYIFKPVVYYWLEMVGDSNGDKDKWTEKNVISPFVLSLRDNFSYHLFSTNI